MVERETKSRLARSSSVIQSVRESGAERLAGCLVEIYQNVLAGKR